MPKILPSQKALRLKCPKCKDFFLICLKCYRGNIYCSKQCSSQARKQSRALADKRYRLTAAGRKKRRLSQDRYRKKKKNVNDHTSPIAPKNISRNDRVLLKDKTRKDPSTCMRCAAKVNNIVTQKIFSFRRKNFGNQPRNASRNKKNVLCRAPPN